MANITFYEKPGCINGNKQQKILKNGGNTLHCINILKHNWQQEELLPFLGDKEPKEFMNYTAPDIKRGNIDPETLGFNEAVNLLLDNPILIKRPLIVVDGMYIQGFTDERLLPYLGDWDSSEDVITCPNLQSLSCDERGNKS